MEVLFFGYRKTQDAVGLSIDAITGNEASDEGLTEQDRKHAMWNMHVDRAMIVSIVKQRIVYYCSRIMV